MLDFVLLCEMALMKPVERAILLDITDKQRRLNDELAAYKRRKEDHGNRRTDRG